MKYFIAFLVAFVLSVILTKIVMKLALKLKVVDQPNQERKIHPKPIPLLGGVAIFLSFSLVVIYYSFISGDILTKYYLPKYIIGFLLSGAVLMIGGFLDDKYNLKPAQQIIFPIIACLIVIASGVGIHFITNPFGGIIRLDQPKFEILRISGLPYRLAPWADLFALLWLLGMMYTTKFLDGLDGLVSGITTIGALVIFFLSFNPIVAQPQTALIAIILAGSCLGFLIFNFQPAKIFLGEGGSLFTGFALGVIAIAAGGKIATALLIMGIPILDVLWVILRRLFWEGKSPFKSADKKHLHFRLLDIGFSQRQAVLFLYFLTIFFGLSALFLQSLGKFYALVTLVAIMFVLASILVCLYKRKTSIDTKE
jgi:UDP-GlcNAc:undecaprenyl-phosphate GlcNAc-1-phosphate transferase